MNLKVALLFLLTLIILVGIPETFALSQYVTNLSEVYGNGSCNTCHLNGASDGPRTAYGILFENQPNHANDPGAALRVIGAPTTNQSPVITPTPAATNLVNNITDIDEANEDETNTTEISDEIPVSTTKSSSGFGLVMAIMVVLSVIYLSGKRR
ncbi:MAG: hypothetical protein FIB07_08545 [Candidatus Methanoperedens sp.]|nr:hypothetical protein [Candidatus Methanoperedens sp.]